MNDSSTKQTSQNGSNGANSGNGSAISAPNSVPHPNEIVIYSDNDTEQLVYTPARPLSSMSQADKEWMVYMAKLLVTSKVNTQGYKEADYIIMMIKAYELGLPFSVVSEGVYIVNGKVCLEGRTMLSLLQASPIIEDVTFDEKPDACTVTIKRKGKTPFTATFTMKDAEVANLLGKTGWKNYPNQMLAWRALAKCARRAAPDILGGLGYTKEELMDEPVFDIAPDSQRNTRQQTPKITVIPPAVITPSSTDAPPPPTEYDPITGKEVNNTPAPTPKSSEPDPNDPEDIRHAIPIYGSADHWYIKNYKSFVKALRKFIPNEASLLDNEVSSAGLLFMGIQTWKVYPSGKDALVAVEAKFNEGKGQSTPKTESKPQATTPPTAPKPPQTAPAPVPTPAPANWHDEFVDWLYTYFDIKNIVEWEAKSGKKITDYKSITDAQDATTAIAQADCWDILATTAKYYSIGRDTYIEFHSLFTVRMYGRSSKFKSQVGDEYYAEYGVGDWKPNGEYEIGLLKVAWRRNEKGTPIAHTVTVLGDGNEDDYPSDLTPEEELALAKIEM